jgi:hypothetical protein
LPSTETAHFACGPGLDTIVASWTLKNVSATRYQFQVRWQGSESLLLSNGTQTLQPGASAHGSGLVFAFPHAVVRFLKSTDNFATVDEADLSPASPTYCGYRIATATGSILDFRLANGLSTESPPLSLSSPVVGLAGAPDRNAIWLTTADGHVVTLGRAQSFGSAAGLRLRRPVVGIARTPTARGYWLAAGDGGVFAFGDARFFGAGVSGASPVVGIATTPNGDGYWLARSDGAVAGFGRAQPRESASHLRAPVVAVASTPTGKGYWLAAADGGVFAYGDARFFGSAATRPLRAPIVAILPTPNGRGYWLVGSDGGIFTYGNAPFAGSTGHWPSDGRLAPVVGMIIWR